MKGCELIKDIEQEWYKSDQVLYNMMEDASNNNFI